MKNALGTSLENLHCELMKGSTHQTPSASSFFFPWECTTVDTYVSESAAGSLAIQKEDNRKRA